MNAGQYLIFVLLPVWLSACGGAYHREILEHRARYRENLVRSMQQDPSGKGAQWELRYYRPSPRYRVTGQVRLTPEEEPFDMATFDGKTAPYIQYAVVSFTLEGKPLGLRLYRDLRMLRMAHLRDLLLVPFRDLTNGVTTYGGGRYLDLRISDIRNGELVIDFNKAYNPYCAYDEGYQCPVPPAESNLKLTLKAGEKNFMPESAKQ